MLRTAWKMVKRGLLYTGIFAVGYYVGAGGCSGRQYDAKPKQVIEHRIEKNSLEDRIR